MVFPSPSTAPPWYSTPTAIVSLPTAAPNCNSLIESPTDTPATENRQNKSYDNIENNNDRPDDDDNNDDVDCFPRQDKQPVLPQDISPTAPTANNTSPSLIESSPDTPATDTRKNKSYDNIENNNDRPDDDVDCFPRQNKQPVLPQDISPTAPTALTANNTSPSLIEMNNYNYNYNRRRTTPARTKQSAYHQGFKTKTKPTHTIVPDTPLLVWNGTQYRLDYTHNHRPSISVWDGTTHTDIVYDDDYDCRTDSDYAYGDSSNMNDPSVQLQFVKCLQAVHIDTQVPQATSQTTKTTQSKQTTTTTTHTHTHTHKDPTPPYKYNTLQLSFLTTHCENTNEYIDEFPLYTVPQYITQKKHPSHDNYLYRRWNNPTEDKHQTKKTRKTNQSTHTRTTTKDDTSVTPTLQTLCTQDTRSSHQTNLDPDTILSITIWNQPMVHYSTECRSDQPPVINHDTPVPVLL